MTEFRHEIPMRWADLDSLKHVNNVVYLDYAAQARAVMGATPAGRAHRTVVEFKKPILLSRAPVVVTSRVEGECIRQDIGVEGLPHVFATVETTYGPAPAGPEPRGGDGIPMRLRLTDLVDGQVGEARIFEIFQESRVPFFGALLPGHTPGRFVVARVEVERWRPVPWREEPLLTRTWVDRVGTSSFTVGAELADEDGVLATSTAILVGFDLANQRSRPLDETERERLDPTR